MSGQVIMLGRVPIIWQTKKQPIVALSTTEAELHCSLNSNHRDHVVPISITRT
jgi:hypothetical protein